MEKRKLTKEDIDKIRNNEGFPIGSDEDIIALSDAPYYTACPNPFINDFISEFGKPYDEVNDNYHVEPFAADVSEGKNDPIYMAHTYHTKVPYKAIMKYILHYTKPGDIVFDGFCGTGMTGLAAQMCDKKNLQESLFISKDSESIQYGPRKAIISDLSPIATFIAHNYTNDIDVYNFSKVWKKLLKECRDKYHWIYETKHTNGQKGIINYVVWSDVFICPTCSKELVFWDVAIGDSKEVKNPFSCPCCNTQLKKSSCCRANDSVFDNIRSEITNQARQIPVMINYIYQGKKFEKKPDSDDLELLKKVSQELNNYHVPTDQLPFGDNTSQPIQSHNFRYVNQFYFDRSALIFSYILKTAQQNEFESTIKFLVTSILTKTGSKFHNIGFKNGKINLAGAMPNVLYIPSSVAERNIIDLLDSKMLDIVKIYTESKNKKNVLIQTCSATSTGLPSNVIDYIFTDPPFGANINYSEMNFIWESWLHVKTNIKKEAIINKAQSKTLFEYQALMTASFTEFYRILKPGRWMTVEFHNSLNAVWNVIQESLQRAGFIIADVRTLDKKQGTFKQMTSTVAVKQDLVISAYKPRDSLKKDVLKNIGTPESAWAFVQQHLEKLPIVVDADNNGKIDILPERQAYLLFDRMVAYHIIQGIPVPLDAADFYKGLDEKFIKRDGMYFLPDQVNEYDTARIKMGVESFQYDLFVSNEKSAIAWLYAQLSEPQTYADIQPKFMMVIKTVERYEAIPELSVLLEENFLQDQNGCWYVPDVTKEADVAKLREKKLWKEFEGYLNTKGKLKLFRSEAIRVGFSRLWKDKKYQTIVDVANRLPEQTIQEDPNLLMYYDISLSRV